MVDRRTLLGPQSPAKCCPSLPQLDSQMGAAAELERPAVAPGAGDGVLIAALDLLAVHYGMRARRAA